MKLYQSLVNQTNKDFVWLIIDDGSKDGTFDWVKKWQLDNYVREIIYIYQENQGKHVAYNKALSIMDTDWHVTVDSDDWLTNEAVEIFYNEIKKNSRKINYVGIVFPKRNVEDKYAEIKWLPRSVDSVNIPDIKMKYKLRIETCILINNEYIKNFSFSIFNDEKFLAETSLYTYLAKYGSFYPVAIPIYEYKFLSNGWTNNLISIWLENPESTIFDLSSRYEYVKKNYVGFLRVKECFKIRLNINALKIAISNSFLVYLKHLKLLDILLLPGSFIWKEIRFKKNDNGMHR